MSDLSTLQSQVLDELHESGTAESTIVKRHLVAALRHYRSMRFAFSEKVATFATVADQESYQTNGTEAPADIMEIDHMQWRTGASAPWKPIERRLYVEQLWARENLTTTGQPDFWGFYRDRIYLWPTPSDAWTVQVHYHFDSARDAATGNEITESSAGTVTNDFFTRGAELLRTRAMYTYSLSRGDRPEVVTSAKMLNNEALQSMLRERELARATGHQAVNCF